MKRSRDWPELPPRLAGHIGIALLLSIGANPKYTIGKISCALLAVCTVCYWITLRNEHIDKPDVEIFISLIFFSVLIPFMFRPDPYHMIKSSEAKQLWITTAASVPVFLLAAAVRPKRTQPIRTRRILRIRTGKRIQDLFFRTYVWTQNRITKDRIILFLKRVYFAFLIYIISFFLVFNINVIYDTAPPVRTTGVVQTAMPHTSYHRFLSHHYESVRIKCDSYSEDPLLHATIDEGSKGEYLYGKLKEGDRVDVLIYQGFLDIKYFRIEIAPSQ